MDIHTNSQAATRMNTPEAPRVAPPKAPQSAPLKRFIEELTNPQHPNHARRVDAHLFRILFNRY